MTSDGTHTAVAGTSSRLTYVGDQSEFHGDSADVGADAIRALLHGEGLNPITTKLTVCDTTIVDGFDLEAAELPIAVKFTHCVFRDRINLEQAKAAALYFVDCRLHGIAADQLQTTFGFVVEKCVDTGGISLKGAHIGGQISFNGTKLRRPGGWAMVADGLTVEQDMRCSDNFEAQGAVRLVGAHIGGQFLSGNSRFLNPGGDAVEASGMVVE